MVGRPGPRPNRRWLKVIIVVLVVFARADGSGEPCRDVPATAIDNMYGISTLLSLYVAQIVRVFSESFCAVGTQVNMSYSRFRGQNIVMIIGWRCTATGRIWCGQYASTGVLS